MAFSHQNWNNQFLIDPDYNDAVNYGVGIFRHNPVSGERYWRIIGIHHLLPDENRGGRNLFFDVLDTNGNRVRPVVWINWVWEGMRPEEQPPFAQGDKPDNEPMGNIALGSVKQIVYAGCNGRNTTLNTDGKSDWVQKVHTNHPDEGNAEGNTIGHHSFYVVWKETMAGEIEPTYNMPTRLVATPISKSQVKLEWVDNNEDESGFRIERSLDMSDDWSEIALVDADIVSYSDTGLDCETLYVYRVRTYNDTDISDYSIAAAAVTLACVEPDPDPIPIPDNIIGIVTTWQDDQKLHFLVPWQAEVYQNRPDGPYLEALVTKEKLQEIIDKTDDNEVRLYIELRRDDEA